MKEMRDHSHERYIHTFRESGPIQFPRGDITLNLSEITLTVSKNGKLKFPPFLLKEMGLVPGDHIRIAYLTNDGTANTFKEFLLTSEDLSDISEEQQIAVPSRLLQQANIPPDADIQIICLDGAIVIGAEPKLNLKELDAVLEDLSVAVDVTDNLSSDTASLYTQLKRTIENLRREYES